MNPPPPWYSAPSLNAPRMRRVASSCSKVRSMPRGFAAPQPKQELVGLGVSSMSYSGFASLCKRNCRSLAPRGMTALRQEQNQNKNQEHKVESQAKPEAKEPARRRRYENRAPKLAAKT